ncbi:MAG TPA: class I SAM-dependent methyltransferase [Ktedonobacteraceae bacterium]
MDWVEAFYTRQDELSGCYTGSPGPGDHERAQAVTAAHGGCVGRVLELGAGGGQSALATAQAGHEVTAIELVPRSAAHARTLVSQATSGTLRVLEDSFYTLALPETFDVICYWDGFGVGTDEQQQALLKRVAGWLAPEGRALIDINTPWYWAKTAGRQMTASTFARQYDFDADGCRMLDHWWPVGYPEERVTQSLRCYSPQDLRLLLKGTGLVLEHVEPGGAVDYDIGTYASLVPLEQAMQFRASLRLASDQL